MGKTVLVTGVSRGIGRAIAERFLDEDYIVIGTYNEHRDEAEELKLKYGSDRIILLGSYDFQNLESVQALICELKHFSIDSLVCNAGMFSSNDDFGEFDLEEFNRSMNCNFYSQLLLTTSLQRNIVDGGSIVLMSSNDAYSGAFASMSYSISKAAVISLMKCLSVNYGRKRVRVNAIAPGAINTAMNTEEQMVISPYFTPLECVGSPKDVAKVVYFLCSSEASFVNGETITIDGGYSNISILLKSEADQALSENIRNFIVERSKGI